jgi:hypothetical protein
LSIEEGSTTTITTTTTTSLLGSAKTILVLLLLKTPSFYFHWECGLVAIYIEKYVIQAKEEEELWKLKLFSPCKNIISRKTL